MKWEGLLKLIGFEAVFSPALLLAGEVSAAQVRLQLSRWVKEGRLLHSFARKGIEIGDELHRPDSHTDPLSLRRGIPAA
jgi:hypothetical protein